MTTGTAGLTGCGVTGTVFAAELWARYALGVEFADPAHIICSITIADTGSKIEALLSALRDIAQKHFGTPPPDRLELTPPSLPQTALNPRQAAFAPAEAIAWQAAAGHVCAEQIMPYPPGIPLLMPGEVIDAEMSEYVQYLLRRRVKIVGPADLQLNTVRVIK